MGDVLTRMLGKAAEQNLIVGLLPEFKTGGIISLQYTDDTILFSDTDEHHLKNLKCILIWFEKISGMRINYHKSELIPINLDKEAIHKASHMFCCPIGAFPIKYLGIPLHFDKLRREDIQPLIDKILRKIASWKGKLLSQAARLVLIKSCLASIPVYLLSFIKFPKWAIKALNTHLANCFWNDSEGNHKYHLANWESISMPKEYGGLGIPSLRDLNICLLSSWLKRYNLTDTKLWKALLDFKYNTSKPNIFCCKDTGASQFFKGFMWATKAAKIGFRWKIGDGKKVKFWEDNWLGNSSLAIQFWDLYVIVNEKNSTIADLWDGNELKCTFRRTVSPTLSRKWLEVVQLASTIELTGGEDNLIWQFTSDGIFTSQSMYKVISFRGVVPVFVPSIWDLKIPPRVHIFLWLLSKNKILTRDNLAKRQTLATESCLFCSEKETSQHLFFDCAVAQLLWSLVSQVLNMNISSFVDVGAKWLSDKKFAVVNIISSATLWSLWKLRNEMCF